MKNQEGGGGEVPLIVGYMIGGGGLFEALGI